MFAIPMHFDLIVTADYPTRRAELRLLDAHGLQLVYRQVDFKNILISRQCGLFDLRNYVRLYVDSGKEAASVAEIGVCIAEQVLGEEIFRKLAESKAQRTLRVHLPGATEEENHLASALARVPWEIARAAADQPTLGEQNLLIRVVHDMAAPATQPLELGKDECLRALFIFAEAPGSPPLAARRERQELLRLFEKEIYPERRIVADWLTHGVTRERLIAQIQDRGGYHIVHWSGHGHRNLLELAGGGGASDCISGEELLGLFTQAGGFIPRLFFLSACHSGDILHVKDWTEFLSVARGEEPSSKQTPVAAIKDIRLEERPGFTGTAHALLQGGVSSVVAMRYAVGDEYACDLAVEFYRALLAHTQPKSGAAALAMARQALLRNDSHARYEVCDHATPVLYGGEHLGLPLHKGRSPSLVSRSPRLHQIFELSTAGNPHFVGRTWELARLGAEFIGSPAGAAVQPVALISGLGGMGKTALTAEVLTLWESRFAWVLLYQAKPNALVFDATLQDIHSRLYAELGRYHAHVQAYPADAIYRPADGEFTGPVRLNRLLNNLVRAMRDEAILLVLDNFETNLRPQAEPCAAGSAEPLWASQDLAWDRCLARLSTELHGAPSRVLLNCRRPLAALAGTTCPQVRLGPLSAGEAALYLREHTELRQMLFSSDPAEEALAKRLLQASRFHPLLMDRLARLATGGSALRPQLLQALGTLEQSHGYAQLPTLFATRPGDAQELAYLSDALVTSLDQLLRHAPPDARRLLWMIAVANEPVMLGLLQSVWAGAAVGVLHQIAAVGLVQEKRGEAEDRNSEYSCHELVRERIRTWMHEHPEDCTEVTETSIRLAYAEQLEAAVNRRQPQNLAAALEAGRRALVYYIQAGAYDRLSSIASYVITSTRDPRLLSNLLPHLQAAVASAPEGRVRWQCLGYLADALKMAIRPEESLPLYERATIQARAAAEAGSREAWEDVRWLTGNWANALLKSGAPDAARKRHRDSADAARQAGQPAIHAFCQELEALRIDIMQGQDEQALPEVEAGLVRVQAWWQQHLAGQPVPEAPSAEGLARALIGALDIARAAYMAQKDGEQALRCIDAILDVQRALKYPAEELAVNRMNRANLNLHLGHFDDVKSELEDCLQAVQSHPDRFARGLGSLAELFDKRGDVSQAIIQARRALALLEQLPDPRDRATIHSNLALYLRRRGTETARAEGASHQLADLVYCLVAGLGESLRTSLGNYAMNFRRVHTAGLRPAMLRVEELLVDPAFHSLAIWLRQRQVDVAQVQAEVDRLMQRARQMALEQE